VTRELLISREARGDIIAALAGYRSVSPALAARFAEELERVYTSVVAYPELYPIVYKAFRRALLRKFPYSVFYIVEQSVLLIVGVVHQARDESTWKRRA
jgi:plasmid stabilization system protein ParE